MIYKFFHFFGRAERYARARRRGKSGAHCSAYYFADSSGGMGERGLILGKQSAPCVRHVSLLGGGAGERRVRHVRLAARESLPHGRQTA